MQQTRAELPTKQKSEGTQQAAANDNSRPSNVMQVLASYGTRQSFGTGQFIIREGDGDKTVFILLSGEVEVIKKDKHCNDHVIATLNAPGTILGEMSIFLNEPRTTSVRVSSDMVALVFTGEKFLSAVYNTPALSMRIIKTLSNKVKQANERFVEDNG